MDRPFTLADNGQTFVFWRRTQANVFGELEFPIADPEPGETGPTDALFSWTDDAGDWHWIYVKPYDVNPVAQVIADRIVRLNQYAVDLEINEDLT